MSSGLQLAQHQATAYETFTRVFMEGSARLLAEVALIQAGDVVLDLADGTGLVARHAAALVSPDGRIVGADINPAMLEIARGNVEKGVERIESPCDALPLDDATLTHVMCEQRFQFIPDELAGQRFGCGSELEVGEMAPELLVEVVAAHDASPSVSRR